MRRITKAVITRGTVRPVVSLLFILSVLIVKLLLLVEISLTVVGIALCIKLKFCLYKHAHHVVYKGIMTLVVTIMLMI